MIMVTVLHLTTNNTTAPLNLANLRNISRSSAQFRYIGILDYELRRIPDALNMFCDNAKSWRRALASIKLYKRG